MRRSKDGRGAIAPISVVSGILGLCVLDRSKGRLWQAASYAYSIAHIVGFCFLTMISLQNLSRFCLTESLETGNLMVQVLLYGHLCITASSIVGTWLRQKPIKDIVSLQERCDYALERIGVPQDHPNIFSRQCILLAVHGTVAVIFAVINCKWLIIKDTPVGVAIALILTLQYPILIINIIDVTFLYWVRCIWVKFERLNQQLRNMLTTSLDSPQHKRVVTMLNVWNTNAPHPNLLTATMAASTCRTKENSALMKAAKQIHLDLTKIGRKTSDAFGTHLLLSMTSSFTLVTTFLYYGYVIFWVPLDPDQYEREMVTLCFWIVLFAFKIVVVSHVCALTTMEASNTGDIICELYEPSTSTEFRTEIREFTLQMIQNPLTFTAHGFFDLDHTFIHATIASITTYLVILIQVGDVSDNEILSDISSLPNSTMETNVSFTTTDVTRFTIFSVTNGFDP